MRVLIVSADGLIGIRLLDIFKNALNGQHVSNRVSIEDIEFIGGVGKRSKPGTENYLHSSNTTEWFTNDISEMSPNDWESIIGNYAITRIYYLNSCENNNEYQPTDKSILKQADDSFIEYLESIESSELQQKLEVVYISTDKLYYLDKFPKETNQITLPSTSDVSLKYLDYIQHKLFSENRLKLIQGIDLKIIRGVNLVSIENGEDYPLTSLIKKAHTNKNIDIFGGGDRGLCFTSIDDLALFLSSDRLFDETIRLTSGTNIINFSRVNNYLSEYLLISKVTSVLHSSSGLLPRSTTNNFKECISTPQIRDMSKMYLPGINIEKIIEDIATELNSSSDYQELITRRTQVEPNGYLLFEGSAEPEGSIIIILETGEMITTDVAGDGFWSVRTEEPHTYTEKSTAEIRALVDGKNYSSVTIEVPKAVSWNPNIVNELSVSVINWASDPGGTNKPYLVISGEGEPLGHIKITLPGTTSTSNNIELHVEIDSNGSWSTQTLPGYYIRDINATGSIVMYSQTDELLTTYEFNIELSPSVGPGPLPDPGYKKTKIIKTEYLVEESGLKRQYLKVSGISEPGALISMTLPTSAETEIPDTDTFSEADSAGNWSIISTIPFYCVRDNLKGEIITSMRTRNIEDIYSRKEFKLNRSPIVPETISDHIFTVSRVYYLFDEKNNYHLIIKGESPALMTIECQLDSELLQLETTSNEWELVSTEPFQNKNENEYTDIILKNKIGTPLKKISIRIPPSPIIESDLNEELKVNKIEYQYKGGIVQEENQYLLMEGTSVSGGTVILNLPSGSDDSQLYKEYTLPVNSSGTWRIESPVGYIVSEPKKFTAVGYKPSGLFFDQVSLLIPISPSII